MAWSDWAYTAQVEPAIVNQHTKSRPSKRASVHNPMLWHGRRNQQSITGRRRHHRRSSANITPQHKAAAGFAIGGHNVQCTLTADLAQKHAPIQTDRRPPPSTHPHVVVVVVVASCDMFPLDHPPHTIPSYITYPISHILFRLPRCSQCAMDHKAQGIQYIYSRGTTWSWLMV